MGLSEYGLPREKDDGELIALWYRFKNWKLMRREKAIKTEWIRYQQKKGMTHARNMDYVAWRESL